MERETLLREPEWYLANIQNDLYALIYEYMQKNKLKKKDIAEKLGVSKGYITQILKGGFDHKISKYVELALSFNKVPIIQYVDLDQYIEDDGKNITYEIMPSVRPGGVAYEMQVPIYLNPDSRFSGIIGNYSPFSNATVEGNANYKAKIEMDLKKIA
jgi:transcriptional regulator with XRE-family HTH domain